MRVGQGSDTNKKPRAVCVLVLGAHRSGTSALTRVLNLQGCALPRTLMGPSHGNEAGHWESDAIAAFNDELLSSAGTSWDDWQAFNMDWYRSPVVEHFAERARDLIRTEFAETPLFVLKDPRICRIASWWLDVLRDDDVEAAIIVPIRHPDEVASSLLRRDGTIEWTGRLLWLRHVIDAEAATRGQRRIFTTYAQLLGNWREVIAKASASFGFVFPRQTAKAAHEVSRFLQSSKIATARPTERPGDTKTIGFDLSLWLSLTYEIMARWADTGEDLADYAALDIIKAHFDEVSEALGPAFSTESYRGAPGAAATLRERVEALTAHSIYLDGLRERAEADLAQAVTTKEALLAERDQLIENHAMQSEELAQIHMQVANLQTTLAEAEHQRKDTESAWRSAQRDFEAAQSDLRHHEAQLSESYRLLNEAGEARNELQKAIDELDKERNENAAVISDLMETNQALNLRHEKSCHENEHLTQEMSIREETIKELREHHSILSANIDNIQLENQSLSALLINQDAQLNHLTKSADEAQSYINHISQQNAELNSQISSLNGRMAEIEDELGRASADSANKSKYIFELNSKLSRYAKQEIELEKTNTIYRHNLDEAKRHADQQDAAARLAKTTIHELQSALQAERLSRAKAEERLLEQDNTISALTRTEAAHAKLAAEADQSRREAAQDFLALQVSVEVREREIAMLKSEISELKGMLYLENEKYNKLDSEFTNYRKDDCTPWHRLWRSLRSDK